MLAFCAQTYVYRMARSDPTFKPSASIPLQAYGNPMGAVQGETLPTHASVACDADGYRPEALLFVDEAWADTAAARGGMSTFLWRPCVKFQSTHYKYVRDPSTNLPRLVQRGVGADAERTQDFGQPASPTATATGLAMSMQSSPPAKRRWEEEEEEDRHWTMTPSEDEEEDPAQQSHLQHTDDEAEAEGYDSDGGSF